MTVLEPFRRARRDLWTPAGRRILWRSLLLSLAAFALLAVAVQYGIDRVSGGQAGWLQTMLDILGGLATVVLVWMLFPAVATLFAGAMLDGFVETLEAQHYPAARAPAPPGWMRRLAHGARFAVFAVAVNVVLLPVYLVLFFLPPLAPVAFVLVNGYLLGREHFDMVATRHFDGRTTKALCKAHRGRLFVTGVILALLFTVPVLNLFAPILGAAAMVHLFHGLRA